MKLLKGVSGHSSSGLDCLVLFCILHINKFSTRRILQECYRNSLNNSREEMSQVIVSMSWTVLWRQRLAVLSEVPLQSL